MVWGYLPQCSLCVWPRCDGLHPHGAHRETSHWMIRKQSHNRGRWGPDPSPYSNWPDGHDSVGIPNKRNNICKGLEVGGQDLGLWGQSRAGAEDPHWNSESREAVPHEYVLRDPNFSPGGSGGAASDFTSGGTQSGLHVRKPTLGRSLFSGELAASRVVLHVPPPGTAWTVGVGPNGSSLGAPQV